jgi:nanoRNase/pAp phosphatase (c-di-AMP/oligoRNAs hydrolase)
MVYPDQPWSKIIPPNIDGKNVIIIDVAYDPDVINEIAKRANKLLFIDHHISIHKKIKSLKLTEPHQIVYNKSHSGASLVWKYFFKTPMPTFVKYIEDNDIGRWKYKETLPFISAIEVNLKFDPTYANLKKWDKLLDDKYISSMVKEGEIYMKYKNYLIDKFSKKYSLMKFPSKTMDIGKAGRYTVAVVNGACPNASLLGKYIVENVNCDFCMIWNYILDKTKYVVSMRSNKVDISKIAKALGGGGHKYAAAFSFYSDKYHIDNMFC